MDSFLLACIRSAVGRKLKSALNCRADSIDSGAHYDTEIETLEGGGD